MKRVLKPGLTLTVILIAVLGVSYIAHGQILKDHDVSNSEAQLAPFYIMNLLMSIVTGLSIIYLSFRKSEITGFIFMGSSLIKFALFFLLFYGDLSENETTRKLQFVAFYIPYALSLFIEVWYLISHLNKSD